MGRMPLEAEAEAAAATAAAASDCARTTDASDDTTREGAGSGDVVG